MTDPRTWLTTAVTIAGYEFGKWAWRLWRDRNKPRGDAA